MSRATLGTRTPDLRFTKPSRKAGKSKASAKRKPDGGIAREITKIAKAMAWVRHVHSAPPSFKPAQPQTVWDWMTVGLREYYRYHARSFLRATRPS